MFHSFFLQEMFILHIKTLENNTRYIYKVICFSIQIVKSLCSSLISSVLFVEQKKLMSRQFNIVRKRTETGITNLQGEVKSSNQFRLFMYLMSVISYGQSMMQTLKNHYLQRLGDSCYQKSLPGCLAPLVIIVQNSLQLILPSCKFYRINTC